MNRSFPTHKINLTGTPANQLRQLVLEPTEGLKLYIQDKETAQKVVALLATVPELCYSTTATSSPAYGYIPVVIYQRLLRDALEELGIWTRSGPLGPMQQEETLRRAHSTVSES